MQIIPDTNNELFGDKLFWSKLSFLYVDRFLFVFWQNINSILVAFLSQTLAGSERVGGGVFELSLMLHVFFLFHFSFHVST